MKRDYFHWTLDTSLQKVPLPADGHKWNAAFLFFQAVFYKYIYSLHNNIVQNHGIHRNKKVGSNQDVLVGWLVHHSDSLFCVSLMFSAILHLHCISSHSTFYSLFCKASRWSHFATGWTNWNLQFSNHLYGVSINMMKHDKYDKYPPNLRSWTLMRLHGVSTVTLINFRGRIGTRVGFGSNKMTSKPKRPDKLFHLTLTFFHLM